MASPVSLALKSSLNTGEPALMPYENSEPASCLNSDRLTWANRVVVVIGAASRTGQTVVAAFAAAGVHRIALVDNVNMSAVQDRALQAASANNLSPPTLLVLQLQHDGDASVAQGVDEILHKWGHVDFIIHHADHELFPVESAGEGERAIRDQRRKSLESGIKNVYSIIDAFLPLLLAGSEKTLINIIPADSADTKPGAGAGMIAGLANRQMADCLMVDHGCDGLLAYSIHLSSWGPGKGIPHAYSANQDYSNPPELDGIGLVYLASKRRTWLAGRHLPSTHNLRELLAYEDVIVRDDLLRNNSSLTFELSHQRVFAPVLRRSGRVPSSSY